MEAVDNFDSVVDTFDSGTLDLNGADAGQANNSSEKKKFSLRVGVQKFGSFLSGMVMPNMGAFIAWGLITALFIPTGWIPNEKLGQLVDPMKLYLLPLLIGYTGGKMVHDVRGGVIGAIATMGIIVGAESPMFLGAMIMGPLGGLCIKYVDKFLQGKIKSGFEMLVNNFSAGIVGGILTVLALVALAPIVQGLTDWLGKIVQAMIDGDILWLANIFIEPAKVLFLNNAINHGVLTPLGLIQTKETGKSILFLLEANPGPGLGVLVAYMIFGKGVAKSTSPGAIIVHFFGGIHEIYFPYILMRPQLLLAVIAGGVAGTVSFTIFGAGLSAPPSPGSIIAILGLAPSNAILGVILGVLIAAGVSFVVAMPFVKTMKQNDEDLANAANKVNSLKGKQSSVLGNIIDSANNSLEVYKNVTSIIFACDAGMGSSAMGATLLGKKVKSAGLNISVTNSSINNLKPGPEIVVTHKDLTDRAKRKLPDVIHISVDNFLNSPKYDELINNILEAKEQGSSVAVEVSNQNTDSSLNNARDVNNTSILSLSSIKLNQKPNDKSQAIKLAGEILVDSGCVSSDYIKYMLEREEMTTTYMGNNIAIPHGTSEAKETIQKSGISIVQIPDGVDFGDGNIAKVVFGIAGKDGTHMDILSKIAILCSDENNVQKLVEAKTQQDILDILGEF